MTKTIAVTAAPKAEGEAVKVGSGGMIQPFFGEFLISPAALEWSLNYCSHACAYCFANLNSPTRKGDASKAMRQVAEIGRRATLTDLYLRNKYPVCIANKTDAFSESNYRETLPVIDALKEAGVPIQFQTKGGKGIEQALDGLPPSVWYITVCQNDDAIRKRIEPNAPSIDERLDLMVQLTELGHIVVAGVNPAVPEWLPEPEELMEDLAAAGCTGAWIEALHLSHKQLQFMPDPVKRKIGDGPIKRAFLMRKEMSPEESAFLVRCMEAAKGAGMNAYSHGHPEPSDYFAPWRQLYPATLPIIQDFANACHDLGLDETRLLSFDDYVATLEAAATPFLKGKQRIGDYMRVASYRTIENIKNWSDHLTFRQLLWFAWNNPGNKLCPASHNNFAVAARPDENGEPILLTDDNGCPYYVFVPEGTDDRFVHYTGEKFDAE